MRLNEWTDFVERLYRYWDLKTVPGSQTITDWFQEVMNIPAIALPDIRRYLCQQEKFPRPLPTAVLEGWRQWKNHNREKIVVDEQPCDDCGGEGLLHYRNPDEFGDGRASGIYCARCGACENSRRFLGAMVKMATVKKQFLIDKGYEVV